MLDLEEVAFIASLLLQQCHCASSMSELGDFDDADSIDWDEAIETLTAVETARATQKTAASSSTDPQSTSTASIRANTATASPPLPLPTDEEILFLYDLIDTSQYILVNDDGEDIEDIAAGMKRGLKPVARTLFDQFRWALRFVLSSYQTIRLNLRTLSAERREVSCQSPTLVRCKLHAQDCSPV